MSNPKKNNVTIVIDTREQMPLDFSPFFDSGIAWERGTLHTGDYSIAGYEKCVAIERKNLDDLVGTLITGYEADTRKPSKRLNRELMRMSRYDVSIILVEASEVDLWAHKYRSMAMPESIMGLLMSVYATYGVPFYFTNTRSMTAKWVATFARHYVTAREKKWFLPDEVKANKTSAEDF